MTSGVNKLVKISHTQGQAVLFVGNPYELLVHGMCSVIFLSEIIIIMIFFFFLYIQYKSLQ